MIQRPDASEHAPYYSTYIDKVPAGDIIEILSDGIATTVQLLQGVPPARETYCYAEGKWSPREVVGHVTDAERVFAYRALCFARGEAEPLPGMDQEVYARGSNAADRSLPALAAELTAVRHSTIELFMGFDGAMWGRSGVASGVPFTVRAFPFIIAGHEIHHRAILKERYLGAP